MSRGGGTVWTETADDGEALLCDRDIRRKYGAVSLLGRRSNEHLRADLEILAARARPCFYAPDAVLMEEADFGNSMFAIVDGTGAKPYTGSVAIKDGRIAAVGRVTTAQLREIAEIKMKDMNANDIDAAVRMLAGSARSMGITVVEG